MDFGHFSLPKKKRYAKNIRIGDLYVPYGFFLIVKLIINNLVNLCFY